MRLALLCFCSAEAAFAAEPFDGVLVRFDARHSASVARLGHSSVQLAPGETGLVVWAEQGGERWQVFRGTWKQPIAPARDPLAWLVSQGPNARGSGSPSPSSLAQLTTQLDPLSSPSVIKSLRRPDASEFLTPPNGGVVLNPRLTIRRVERAGRTLPRAAVVLSDGTSSAMVVFQEGQAAVPFGEIPGLPAAWADGLPAGPYTLRLDTGPPVGFTVEPAARYEQVMSWIHEWKRLGSGAPLLSALVAVEYLLAQQPHPYLADAFDVLDGLPQQELPPYLGWRRRQLCSLLQSEGELAPPELEGDATGIAEIDSARMLIVRGRWNEARTRLDAVADAGAARSQALADLYRGVIYAESGLSQEQVAEFYFRRAVEGLRNGTAADRFRAHNDYANFLLNRSQDRLFNHALQMATGVRGVFVAALVSWEEARQQYEMALDQAKALGAGAQASVRVNLARADAILADVIGTLDHPGAEGRQLVGAERALNAQAGEQARQAIALCDGTDPYVPAAAETILAHLAFRAQDFPACGEHAARALDGYLRAGSLAGIETIERLLGLLALRAPESAAGGAMDEAARRAALDHFRRSHLLSELLRAQIPADHVGLTRAGFFARRVFVNEQIVELLIAGGQDLAALRYAELAKARALQDLLATQTPQVPDAAPPSAASPAWEGPADSGLDALSAVLDEWPPEVMALEYFLTAERAWLFVVDTAGKVQAHPLLEETGKPLAARDLVARVQACLSAELNQYSVQLQQRILSGRGVDHGWQETLYHLGRVLVPPEVLAQLNEARTLVIVPHHILHYFPFAALVTQRDVAPRQALEMVQPRFLIDERCCLCYAPSLSAWAVLRQRPDRPLAEAAAIGITDLPGVPPLPGVRAELQSLKLAFGQRVTAIVTGELAHKASAFALLNQPGLVLIGTHGKNWPDQPLASELLLYPQGRDRGRLTAAELYFSQVRSDLVVLSACYTGLADKSPLPGDDLFGLQRALLRSGTRCVVSGQWDIFDGTGPKLMEGFFNNLAQGQRAPAALADSQRQFLARLRASREVEPWLHPYFWAVYTVTGDDRTRFVPPP